MVKVNKKKYLVLDNGSGGRAVLEVQKEFSSVIPFRQIRTNGNLDLSSTRDNFLRKEELERYNWEEFDEKDPAFEAVENGLTDKLSGTSDLFSS